MWLEHYYQLQQQQPQQPQQPQKQQVPPSGNRGTDHHNHPTTPSSSTSYRGIAVVEVETDVLALVLYGTHARRPGLGLVKGDDILVIYVNSNDGSVIHQEWNTDVHHGSSSSSSSSTWPPPQQQQQQQPHLSHHNEPTPIISENEEKISRIVRVSAWPGERACLAVALQEEQFVGTGDVVNSTFEVHCVSFALPKKEDRKGVRTCCDLSGRGRFMGEGRGEDGSRGRGEGRGGGGGDNGTRGGLTSRTEHLSTLPESCVQIAILQSSPPPSSSSSSSSTNHNNYGTHNTNNDGIDTTGKSVVIGLSPRGKLFCGESLLVAGVSSFVANVTLDVLMYVTTGTRPVLQFVSITALAALDPLAMEGNPNPNPNPDTILTSLYPILPSCLFSLHYTPPYFTTMTLLSNTVWEERAMQVAWPFAEPRPVERGARLIIAIR